MTTGRINQVSKIQSRQLALVSLKIVRIKIHKCVRMNLRPSAKKSSFVALPLQSDYGVRPGSTVMPSAATQQQMRLHPLQMRCEMSNFFKSTNTNSKTHCNSEELLSLRLHPQSAVACPQKSGLKHRQLGILF